MTKPHIICYMMMSVDGRIDCSMLEAMPGDEYYTVLGELDTPTTVSGRVTAELEIAEGGKFTSFSGTPVGKTSFYKAEDADGYDIITDTKGTLLWNDGKSYSRPMLILLGENADTAYTDYLKSKNISWIACGKDKVDLKKAVEILADEFGVKRMAVVGGGHINAGFLEAGLLDEVHLLIGPGIDGRKNMTAVFDGLPENRPVTPLKLTDIKSFENGTVLIKYDVIK